VRWRLSWSGRRSSLTSCAVPGFTQVSLPPPSLAMCSLPLGQAAHDARQRRVTPLQAALAGELLTFHSFGNVPEDES
jgi:hypothetical protein